MDESWANSVVIHKRTAYKDSCEGHGQMHKIRNVAFESTRHKDHYPMQRLIFCRKEKDDLSVEGRGTIART
jgi:hypothetical protein